MLYYVMLCYVIIIFKYFLNLLLLVKITHDIFMFRGQQNEKKYKEVKNE